MTTRHHLLRRAALSTLLGSCALLPLAAGAGSLTVTSLSDSGPGSLRAAIANAADGDVITFAVTGTITNLTGELAIIHNLALIGPGPNTLAISGNNSSRVFNIAGGAAVNLSGLTVSGGRAPDGAPGSNPYTPGSAGSDGGGIYNAGTLALSNCVITGCGSGRGGGGYIDQFGGATTAGGAGGNGGGLYNAGTLTMTACMLISNTCGSGGNAGLLQGGSSWGAAGGNGGNGAGIYDLGTLTATGCAFGFNSAGPGGLGGRGGSGAGGGQGGDGGSGGALYSQSSPTFISCTFAGNAAGAGGHGGAGGSGLTGDGGPGGNGGAGGNGGGLYCPGFFQLVACTFTTNSAGQGGQGGQGGAGALGGHLTPAGNGGNGGNGGDGGSGGAAGPGYGSSTLQNVLAAGNSAAAGGLPGPGGAAGIGFPPAYPGSPGYAGSPGSGPDLLGAFTSNGHNLIGLNDGNYGFTDGILGDIVGSGAALNPKLGPLANNSGPTFTCALLSGSPALDAGDDTLPGSPWNLATDQRGLPRQSGLHPDIGAFELQWASTPVRLATCARTSTGVIQVTLTNIPGASLTLLASTNLALPISAWTSLGSISEIAPGQFQFQDITSTNSPQRFYRARCP